MWNKNNLVLLIGVICLGFSFSACQKEEEISNEFPDPKSSAPYAKIMLVNENSTIYADSIAFQYLSFYSSNGLIARLIPSFNYYSPYINLPTGNQNLTAYFYTNNFQDSSILLSTGLNVDQSKFYSLFIAPDTTLANPTNSFILEDDLSTPAEGNAHFRLVHLSPDAPAVDVTLKHYSSCKPKASADSIKTQNVGAGLALTLVDTATLINLSVLSKGDSIAAASEITISIYEDRGVLTDSTDLLQTTGILTLDTGIANIITLDWELAPGSYRLVAEDLNGKLLGCNVGQSYPKPFSTIKFGEITASIDALNDTLHLTNNGRNDYFYNLNWKYLNKKIIQNIAFKNGSSFTPVLNGSYTLVLELAGTDISALEVPNTLFQDRKIYSLIARGFLNTAQHPNEPSFEIKSITNK